MATPQRYRFRSGVEYLIDLDAAGENMRRIYNEKLAEGTMWPVVEADSPGDGEQF